MGEIIVSKFKCNHADRDSGIAEKVFGHIDFHLQNIVFDVLSSFLFEKFSEIFRTQMNIIGNVFYGNILCDIA